MRLEKHELLDRLEALGARLDCPCCGTTSWNLFIEEPENLENQRVMEFALRRLAGGISVALAALVCGRCGFVRLHSVDHLIGAGRSA